MILSAVQKSASAVKALFEYLGQRFFDLLDLVGAVWYLLFETIRWFTKSLLGQRTRLGRPAIIAQIVRVGVRSIFIISLVSGCVGLILVLQMAPPLDEFGQKELVANITAVAVLRELGPLIAAIVLTGFAGAAIAAEIGTMVVGEEIEALEAHALNPIRFLVLPRVLATVLSMTCLAVISNLVAVGAGMFTASIALDIGTEKYIQNTLLQVKLVDFLTGIGKASVFGLLIGLIACTNGLRVTGGAAGVGRATTGTVVQSVVAIIIADLIFTAVFYALGFV
jgi:phospholipid/cholesterol/gamma-HCH transport system permease protein